MRAVQVKEFGGPEVLDVRELPAPQPGPAEVVVDVEVADVMFLDTRLRSGWGQDFFPLSTQQAVALAHDGRTALAVFDRAAVQPDSWVLITAAAGGLGTLLIQLSVAAGAKVVAAARGADKLALAERLGATAVVDYSIDNWEQRVREITSGGAHVVFDGTGGAIGGQALTAAADKGLFLGYGSAAGNFATVDADAAAARGVTVLGLFDIVAGEVDWSALARRAQADVVAGRLEVVIGQTFPIDQVEHAHSAIESRSALGRTLLTIGASL